MVRSLLLWASTNPFLAERLPRSKVVRRATQRFMPGERLEDALEAAEPLGGLGIGVTVTQLGENLDAAADADAVLSHYLGALKLIRESELDAEISVKPTQLGLDFSHEDAKDRLLKLVQAAAPSPVWMDMEASTYVDATLDLYRAAVGESSNAGLCLQAYLHRTADDLDALLPLDPSIRLVKGAYLEAPEITLPTKAEVNANFLRLARTLLEARAGGGSGRPVVASHDPAMLDGTIALAESLKLSSHDYEFAMLYGIARRAQARLADAGHRVRVLISYGEDWFPWYMRRLAERPANLWFVLKQIRG